MPKLTKSVPKYSKHRASGQAVVTIAGRDIYLGPHGSKASKLEYDRVITEWLANGRTVAQDDEAPRMSINELMAAHVKHQRKEYANWREPSSEPTRCKIVYGILRELYGRESVDQFGPLKLKAVRQKLIERGQCRGFVNENVNRVRRLFKWGVGEELVPGDVFQSLSAVTGLRKGRSDVREGRMVRPADEEAIRRALPYMPEVVADMVRLQRLLGCRPGEVCQMRPGDIDRTGDVWLYRPATHKTQHHGKDRIIPVGPKAQAILTPYLLRPAGAFCFCPKDSEKKRRGQRHADRKTPMSCGNRPGTNVKGKPKKQAGECYTRDSYRRAIARACEKAGVPKWSPNQLRHTAATEIRKRYGLEAAQVVLGHSNAAITQVYAERDLSLAVRVAAEVG